MTGAATATTPDGRVEISFPAPSGAPANGSVLARTPAHQPTPNRTLARKGPPFGAAGAAGGSGEGGGGGGGGGGGADRESLRREILAILREETELGGGPALPF
jgi:hypothetical protein